jgi:hypothetical protein
VCQRLAPRDLSIHAVYASRKHMSVAVRTMLDFLAESFAAEPAWDRQTKQRAGYRSADAVSSERETRSVCCLFTRVATTAQHAGTPDGRRCR